MSQADHDRIKLPDKWWDRFVEIYQELGFRKLEDFCADTGHPKGSEPSLSPRTLYRAKNSTNPKGQITADVFDILLVKLDLKTRPELLDALHPATPATAPTAAIQSKEKIPTDVVGEALVSVSSLPDFVARDIATQDELHRLWQIDCAAYGERSITFEQFFTQWQAFPHFPKALFFQNEIAAAIGILPTTEARMKDFAEGRVREASLQDDPVGQFMIGNVSAWLIDGMVRNPKFPMVATRELVCSSILSWINDGLICYPLNIYAIGQNRRGMNLITRAGFKLIKTAESLPDGMPFYVLNVESEAKLLRLLLERLRCYASITP